MVALTESAVAAVRQVILTAEEPVAGLRVTVASGGCAGLRYSLELDVEVLEGDAVFRFGEVTVLVGADSLAQLAGTEIDFVDSPEGGGFVFANPNAGQRCGCGKSMAC